MAATLLNLFGDEKEMAASVRRPSQDHDESLPGKVNLLASKSIPWACRPTGKNGWTDSKESQPSSSASSYKKGLLIATSAGTIHPARMVLVPSINEMICHRFSGECFVQCLYEVDRVPLNITVGGGVRDQRKTSEVGFIGNDKD